MKTVKKKNRPIIYLPKGIQINFEEAIFPLILPHDKLRLSKGIEAIVLPPGEEMIHARILCYSQPTLFKDIPEHAWLWVSGNPDIQQNRRNFIRSSEKDLDPEKDQFSLYVLQKIAD